MTITQLIDALNEKHENRFGNDFAGFYDISRDEAERIAEKAASADEFEAIWENEGWWRDA